MRKGWRSMNNEEKDFLRLGFGSLMKDRAGKPPESIREFEREGKLDPRARRNVTRYKAQLQRLTRLSTRSPLPSCPKCGSKIRLETEIREHYRLACFTCGHGIEVERKVDSTFWVPSHFFPKPE